MPDDPDSTPETQPVRPTDASSDPAPADPTPADPAPADPAPVPAAPAKRSLRERFAGTGDRVYGTRGLVAASLAALIVGGFGGAAIHAAVDDAHDHERNFGGNHPGEMGRDFGGFGERRGEGERPGPPGDFFPEPPGGMPGQPPTTTPEDEESSPTPSPSESPSESSNS